MRKENAKSTILYTDKLHIESKTLFLDLKENAGGKFLQIAELSNARRSTVVIPLSGFNEFMQTLKKISIEHSIGEGELEDQVIVGGEAILEEV
ncbi:hypothetical protein MNBD_DELTA02-858 [hydrothermal vent metagenome]|uniref:Uncharacterized protein n=1 Tax=hydrothermal vent metagenome TaxID=652676 RepID=A0A3B0V6K2_9ZZZZ